MQALPISPPLSVMRLAACLAAAVTLAASVAGAAQISFVVGTVDAKGVTGGNQCASIEVKTFTAREGDISGAWEHPRAYGEIRVSAGDGKVDADFSGDYIDGSMMAANIVGADIHLRFDITHEWGGCELALILPGVIAGQEEEAAANAPKSGAPPMAADMARDLGTWQGVQNSTNAADFEGYIAAFPKGLFVELARARIKTLGGDEASRLAGRQEEQARRENNLAALGQTGKDAVSQTFSERKANGAWGGGEIQTGL